MQGKDINLSTLSFSKQSLHYRRSIVSSWYWLASTLSVTEEEPRPPLYNHSDIAKTIWKQRISPKSKHFLWRLASKAIAVTDNLIHRNIRANPYCSRCCIDIKTSDHVFFTYSHSSAIWKATWIPCVVLVSTPTSLEDKLRYLLDLGVDKRVEQHICILPFWFLWRIWKGRNEIIFIRKLSDNSDELNKAQQDTKEWLDKTEIKSFRTKTCVPSNNV